MNPTLAPNDGRLRCAALIFCSLTLAAAPVTRGAENQPPPGFASLFNGRDFSGWKVPAGDNGHWKVRDGVIDYDAESESAGDQSLWTEREFDDFILYVDWRIKETPFVNSNVFYILPDGTHARDTRGKELRLALPDSDSGIFLRGSGKYQVNIWCWPIGSGEMYGVRTDSTLPDEVRAAVTPRSQADKPVGEWNHFEITVRGNTVSVALNGKTVIPGAPIPGLPPRGPLALQHHGGKKDGKWNSPPALVQFRNIFIKENSHPTAAADRVFSGPQVGETTTPFKVTEITGINQGKERDPVTENAGAPTALVFVHAIERSLVPLLRIVDEYGAERTNGLKTEVVFLFGDRVAGEERVKAAAGSLKLRSRVGLSLDGAEGPGNYGLNKECMMTILAAKENKVIANFALVQPGIADAPRVLEALANACGDTTPPTAGQLRERQMARGGGRGERMERGGSATNSARPREDFPGAVPDDPELNSLLRRFIRPTNDDATVDKLLKEVEAHIEGNADLTRQASNGWVRVLHFGDRYGTPYSRKIGQAFLDGLKAAPTPPK